MTTLRGLVDGRDRRPRRSVSWAMGGGHDGLQADANDSKVSGRWVAILGFQPNNSSRAGDDEPADRTGQR